VAAASGGPQCTSTPRAPGCPRRLPVRSGPDPLHLPHSYCPGRSNGPSRRRTSHSERHPERRSRTAFPRNSPGLTALAQLVCLRVQGAIPRLQARFSEVRQRPEHLLGRGPRREIESHPIIRARHLAAVQKRACSAATGVVNGNRKLISCRQVKFDQFRVHSESAVSAGTRPRSRFLSR
jgi:hypothetical protein